MRGNLPSDFGFPIDVHAHKPETIYVIPLFDMARYPLGEAGLIFPKEALSRLKLQKGDTLFLTETKEGYLLTPYNPEFEAQMKQAEDVMSRYRNTLKELAK